MQNVRAAQRWRRFDALEQALCLHMNGASRHAPVRGLFVIVSRLGDGVLWYVLTLAFALGSEQGARVALQMCAGALLGLAVYRHLKQRLVRERPYLSHRGIRLGTAPLDRYSFPSGHTLHATCLTTIATTHAPELATVLVPFAVLVAASRVVLGLHYPTDVVAGAALGGGIGAAVLEYLPV
jgi:undecaprenyl-diphosphatase